jgi:hypothetical protein
LVLRFTRTESPFAEGIFFLLILTWLLTRVDD